MMIFKCLHVIMFLSQRKTEGLVFGLNDGHPNIMRVFPEYTFMR